MIHRRLRKIVKDGRKGRKAGPLRAHFVPVSDVAAILWSYTRPSDGGDEESISIEADDNHDEHELTEWAFACPQHPAGIPEDAVTVVAVSLMLRSNPAYPTR
jgi:hypothetical protein